MGNDLRTQIQKLAEIGGGDGNDGQFELAFSDLAHAYLAENAPTLEQYELGFQLLERSDDGERAVGITGFKIGNELIYSPVFWLRGRIKGHELLFLHKHSLFVPLKENWLNYLLNRKPQRVGDRVVRNARQLGLRQPDLPRMTRSPKYAAVFGGLEEPPPFDVKAVAAAMSAKRARQIGLLPAVIREMGPVGAHAFGKLAECAPRIFELAYDSHGDDLLNSISDAIRNHDRKLLDADINILPRQKSTTVLVKGGPDANGHYKMTDPKEQAPTVLKIARVVTAASLASEPLLELADPEREEIVRNGYTVQDSRDDNSVSVAYRMSSRLSFTNPDLTGLYDVITRTHGLQKALVIKTPWTPDGRCGKRCVVVFLDADDDAVRWRAAEPKDVWVTHAYTADECRQYIDGLPKASDGLLGAERDYNEYVILASNENGCDFAAPMRIERTTDDGSERRGYWVRSDYYFKRREERDHREERVVIDNNGPKQFRAFNRTLYAPKDTRALVCKELYSSNIALGRPADLRTDIESSLSKLAVYRHGTEIHINSDLGESGPMGPLDAIRVLVQGHGLRAKAAAELLKTAEIHNVSRVHVKYADSYPNAYLRNDGYYSEQTPLPDVLGSIMTRSGEAVPTRAPESIASPVPIPREPLPYQVPYHSVSHSDLEIAQSAAESGQQDVFDASVLTTMLRNMRDDQLIDRFIPALARALDVTGQLLFQFYWHQDDFSERYGDKDMPDLEDSLRNLFEGLGDIVLKLKQKTVSAYPESESTGVSLDDLAGAS